MQQNFLTGKKRLLSLLVAAIFLFCGIFLRLAYIQVVWGAELQTKAADQWTRDLPIVAYRGEIVDRNGVVLAGTKTGFALYARPASVDDAEAESAALADVLGLPQADVYAKISKKGVSEVRLVRQMDETLAEKVRALDLPGVYLAEQGERVYGYGDMLCQTLGFVSADGTGQTGLEAYYDKYLKGVNGSVLTETDLVGKELSGGEMTYVPAIDGMTLRLTIDMRVQSIVEDVLQLAYVRQGAASTKCIVMDVNSGEILAMGAKPGVDLNNLPRDDVQTLLKNSKNTLLTDVYEPGSTFKILTAAACLNEYEAGNPNAFGPDHIFNSSGVRIIDGSKISCWTKHANGKHSNENLADALKNSCNPVFTDIALSLGKDTFYKYLSAFGYGAPSGIDFDGEQGGLLVSQSTVTRGDLARIGFGQTIAVTAMQLACATAAAVNGGLLLRPYLVKEIVDPTTGQVAARFGSEVRGRTVSESTSKQIAEMLRRVVAEGGGKNANVEGCEVGGKTGTAQKFVDGKLAVGKYVSSFVGFFPASAPKYLVLFIVDEPQGQSYGSIVAAPYAGSIIRAISESTYGHA